MSDEIIIEQCTICKKIQRIICRDGSTITLRKHKCSECQPAEKATEIKRVKKMIEYSKAFVTANKTISALAEENKRLKSALIKCWAFAKCQAQWEEYDSDKSDTKLIEQALKGTEK